MVMTKTIMLDQFGLIFSKKRAKYAEKEFVQLLKKNSCTKKVKLLSTVYITLQIGWSDFCILSYNHNFTEGHYVCKRIIVKKKLKLEVCHF